MDQIVTVLVSSLVAIISAITSLVVAKLTKKRTDQTIEDLKKEIDASDGIYYVKCPKCGNKIYLSGSMIHTEIKIPEGLIDD